MMRLRNIIVFLLFIFASFSMIIPQVYANLVVIPTPEMYAEMILKLIFIFIIAFVMSTTIEFGIIYIFLRKNLLKSSKLFKSVVFINFSTFPITQIIAFFFVIQYSYFIGLYFIADFVPITLECFLFLWIFKRVSQDKYLQYPISKKKIFIFIFAANMVTFIIGAIIFPPPYIPYYLYPLYLF